jgi:hypothetical protein
MMGNTLYEQFHNNVQGVQPLISSSSSLDSMQSTYENVRDNLTQALGNLRATYTGAASDSMSDAFTPLASSFNDGANFAGSASLANSLQAESFATAHAKIQNQVPVPAAPWYESVDPWNTDHDDAVNKNSQIDAANEAAYTAYGNDTSGNLGYVQPVAPDTSGFGNFTVTQQGNSMTVGALSGSAGSTGSVSGGGGSSGHVAGSRFAGRTPDTYVGPSPRTTSSSSTNPGGTGGTTPPGVTSTSGYTPPSTSPGGGTGPGNPGRGYPIGTGGGPGGTGGGQFGGSGPGSVFGPVGGTGALGGGGGSAGSVGRGGFGPTGGAPGAGGASGSGARSGVGSTAGIGEEAEMEGAAAGRSGASGMPGAMAGRGGRGGDDKEHRTASYLTNEDNGNLIVGDFDPVAPPVIGEE